MPRLFLVGCIWGLFCLGGIGISIAQAQVEEATEEEAGSEQGRGFLARVNGYQQIPAVSTPGHGTFTARIAQDGQAVAYVLRYADLQGRPLLAHLQFGRRGTKGGVMVVLCQTGDHPDPTGDAPRCNEDGVVEGVITERILLDRLSRALRKEPFVKCCVRFSRMPLT
jgi:hypothetical protein